MFAPLAARVAAPASLSVALPRAPIAPSPPKTDVGGPPPPGIRHRWPARFATLAILTLILIGAATLRIYKIGDTALWLDEYYSIDLAAGRGYWLNDIAPNVLVRFAELPAGGNTHAVLAGMLQTNHPPLYFLALHVWMAAFGDQDSAVRALSVVFSILAILAFFDTARLLHGKATAFWAAAIMALASEQIIYAQEARGYTMLLALTLAGCDALVRIEKFGANRKRIAALGLCVLGMLLTRYLAIPLIAVFGIYAALRFRGRARTLSLAALLLASALFCAAWGPVMWWQHADAVAKLAWQISGEGAGDLHDTLIRICQLPIEFFIVPTRATALVGGLAAAFYILPALLLRRRPDLLLWWLMLVVGVGVLAVSDLYRGSNVLSYTRYLLPQAAAAIALAAAVCSSMKFWRHAAPLLLVLGCAGSVPESYLRWMPDFRSYVQAVDAAVPAREPLLFIRTNVDDATDASLCLSLRRYSSIDRAVMFISGPVRPSVVNFLGATHDAFWLVQSGGHGGVADPQKMVPGSQIRGGAEFAPFAVGTQLFVPQLFARAR